MILFASCTYELGNRTWPMTTTAVRSSIDAMKVSVGIVVPSQLLTVVTFAPGTRSQIRRTEGKLRSVQATLLASPCNVKQDAAIDSATVTFGTIAIVPGGAPTIGASSSPTLRGMSHHPSLQASTPRSAHSVV